MGYVSEQPSSTEASSDARPLDEAAEQGDEREVSSDEEPQRGPHAWLNWQALRAGLPARSSSRTHKVLVAPLWQEFGFYSDSHLVGALQLGPYRLLNALPARIPALGQAELSMVLRAHDHLLDPNFEPIDLTDQDVNAYAGGDLGDQLASLLALALGRRVRSGGVMRHAFEHAPEGEPFFAGFRPPALGSPWHAAVLPSIAAGARLDDAEPYLQAYARLQGRDAVALQRAANQYADALWWADADPRSAWIKLFGALEAAADRWDLEAHPDPVDQLKRRHPGLFERLKRKTPDALPIVAGSLSGVLGAESKMIQFALTHAPDPPAHRSAFTQLDWNNLEQSLHVLYDHRSRDVHAGIPFPSPLCEPPPKDDDGLPAEVFPALGASSGGASWPSHRLPMYLHTFAYIVGGALRRWWLGKAAR